MKIFVDNLKVIITQLDYCWGHLGFLRLDTEREYFGVMLEFLFLAGEVGACGWRRGMPDMPDIYFYFFNFNFGVSGGGKQLMLRPKQQDKLGYMYPLSHHQSGEKHIHCITTFCQKMFVPVSVFCLQELI